MSQVLDFFNSIFLIPVPAPLDGALSGKRMCVESKVSFKNKFPGTQRMHTSTKNTIVESRAGQSIATPRTPSLITSKEVKLILSGGSCPVTREFYLVTSY